MSTELVSRGVFHLFDDYDDLTEDQIEKLRDEYEFFDEYMERDDELQDMTLEEFDEYMRMEVYGANDDELDSGDEDAP